MHKTDKSTVRARSFILAKCEQIPQTLKRLREAAQLLTEYGWFDEHDIDRFSRWEAIDLVRDAIGEAAEAWGVPAAERVVRALEGRQSWIGYGYEYDVAKMLEQWREKQLRQD